MSNYRDDVNVTATISETLISGFNDLGESTAFAASVLLFSISALVTDTAVASNEVIDRSAAAPAVETMAVSDQIIQTARTNTLFIDAATVTDSLRPIKVRSTSIVQASASDVVTERLGAAVVEVGHLSDEVSDSRTASQIVIDSTRADGFVVGIGSTFVEDSVLVSDTLTGRMKVREIVASQAAASDDLIGAISNKQLVVDSAGASSEATGVLRGVQLVSERAEFWDEVLHTPTVTAWTACTDEWSLSRYAPFKGNSVTLIGNTFYVAAEDGVYALDGSTELIHAELRTGKIKLGDELHLADSVYMDYSMEGEAEMTVSRSLEGEETYTYPLESGESETMTAGRFRLGRGIKDKYLTFNLTIDGFRCAITRLYVSTQKFTRRIK